MKHPLPSRQPWSALRHGLATLSLVAGMLPWSLAAAAAPAADARNANPGVEEHVLAARVTRVLVTRDVHREPEGHGGDRL